MNMHTLFDSASCINHIKVHKLLKLSSSSFDLKCVLLSTLNTSSIIIYAQHLQFFQT